MDVPDPAVTLVQLVIPVIEAGELERPIAATQNTFAGVVTAVLTQSVLVLVLLAVVLLPVWSLGVVVLIPVTAAQLHRQVVVLENDTVTVWLDPLVIPLPRHAKTRRVPSLTLRISVHVPPAPLTDSPAPPEVATPQTIAVSPVPGTRVCVPLVVAEIRLLAGVLATTGKPINCPSYWRQNRGIHLSPIVL